jgi:hypothetical protein
LIGKRFPGFGGAGVAREFKGKRHALGEPLTTELIKFCNERDMTPSKVIRRAVREFLDKQKSQPRRRPEQSTEN